MGTGRDGQRSWWRRHPALAAIALIVLALVIWRLVSAPHGQRPEESAAVAVVTATAQKAPFTVYESAVGSVTPLNEVTVRSRVTGRLASVAFTGGEMVKRGELLAQIDPRPFEISLQSAEGELARDQAASANATGTLQRYRQLLAEKSVTPQQFADQQAAAGQGAGNLQVAQSQLATAKLQLAWTRITSPIDGMVGLPQVDPGNVVSASDAQGITTVTQLRPIGVAFAVPGNAAAALVQRLQAGTAVPVAAYGSGSDKLLATGRLLGANNQIDPATGTVKLKAEFDNAAGELFPNQFVTVKLPVAHLADAVLVPAAAIQHGADGTFVYVVDKDHKAVATPVRVGPGDAATSVVESGVAPGAIVVVQGGDALRNGVKVKPVAAAESPAGTDGSAPHGSGVGGQGAGGSPS